MSSLTKGLVIGGVVTGVVAIPLIVWGLKKLSGNNNTIKSEEKALATKILDILNTFKTEEEIASDLGKKSIKEVSNAEFIKFRTNNGEMSRCKFEKIVRGGEKVVLNDVNMVSALGAFQLGWELETLSSLSSGQCKSGVIKKYVQNFNFSENKIQINYKNGECTSFELQNQVNLKVSCLLVNGNGEKVETEFVLSKERLF